MSAERRTCPGPGGHAVPRDRRPYPRARVRDHRRRVSVERGPRIRAAPAPAPRRPLRPRARVHGTVPVQAGAVGHGDDGRSLSRNQAAYGLLSSDVIRAEEERFGATLEQGIERIRRRWLTVLKKRKRRAFPGGDVFALYDTYGFPMDLTRLMAEEKGFSIDEAGSKRLMGNSANARRDAAKKGDESGLYARRLDRRCKARGRHRVRRLRLDEHGECNVCRYKKPRPRTRRRPVNACYT